MPKSNQRCMVAALTGIFILGAGAGPALAPALAEELARVPDAKAADRLALGYKVYAGGMHMFSIDTSVALRPDSYAADFEVRTDGSLSWFMDWKLRSKVKGETHPEGLRPVAFRSESNWKGKERWVDVTYSTDGNPLVEAVPPPDEDDRERVPDDLRVGTIDPLSAGLNLVHMLTAGGRCDGTVSIFDGRRRFDAASEDAGPTEIPISDIAPYGGEAIACRLSVVPVKGFWRDQRYRVKPQDVLVYLRPALPGTPLVPVRVEANTRFGAIRVHLVSVGEAGSESAADSSR